MHATGPFSRDAQRSATWNERGGRKIVRQPRRAYTLFELLLVLVLLVLLAAIAYPTRRAYRFAVISGKGNFRVAPDSPEFWGGGDPPVADSNNPPLVVEDSLPRGVRFSTPDTYQTASIDQSGDSALPPGSVDPGSWSAIVTFLPDGTTKEDVEIVFTGAGARPVDVKLRGLTGAVSVQTLNGP